MKKLSLILASLWLSLAPAAAQTLVPNLGAAGAVSDTDLMAIYQGASPLKKVTGAQVKVYANTSAVNPQTGTTYTVLNSDQNKLVTLSNAAAVTVTLPDPSGGNFGSGWAVSFRNLGAGTVTINRGTSSTIDGATSAILLPGQGFDLYSDGTNYFTQGGRGTIVAKGTLALGTSAISSAACATVVTASATGVATTDVVSASFNGDPTAVTGYVPLTSGMLTIVGYPTANNVNFKVCNNTTASITPGAVTLNWQVLR